MNLSMNTKEKRESGFTLLELLIVVSIIAILSVALVMVLNPAEALRKARDSQRLSDLSTMKTALGLYMTSTTTPQLAGTSNTACKLTPTTAWASPYKIYYSSPTSVTDVTLDNSSITTVAQASVGAANLGLTDGGGWIPVIFDTLTGGSPISNLPIDPVNALATGGSLAGITSADMFYRYACSQTPLAFEIDATLESTAYTSTDDKRASDGGNSTLYYEVGTNLKILGAGGSATLDF